MSPGSVRPDPFLGGSVSWPRPVGERTARLAPGAHLPLDLRVVASALRSPFGGLKTAAVRVKPDGPGLRHLAGLLESGAIRTHVSHTFPLDQIAEAHRQSQTKRTVGKIVVTIP